MGTSQVTDLTAEIVVDQACQGTEIPFEHGFSAKQALYQMIVACRLLRLQVLSVTCFAPAQMRYPIPTRVHVPPT